MRRQSRPKALTVQRLGHRLVLFITAFLENVACHTLDITRAYTLCTTSLERKVFIRPPIEMILPGSKVLTVVKPVYGISESELHWYLIFMEHHTIKLEMCRFPADPCVLYRQNGEHLGVIVIPQVDDSLIGGS